MRILQLSKFYPPVSGGIESVVFELAEGMTRRGLQVDVLCANTQGGTVHEQGPGGYPVTRAGSWGRWLSTSMAPSLVRLVRQRCADYDVIHAHMPDPLAAIALYRAQPKAKLVLHWHSDVVRQRLGRTLYAPLQDWVLRRADAVIATSQRYADSSPCLRPWKHKTHIVPIGITDHAVDDCASQVAALRERFKGKRLVFSLGRMTYYKGFDVLIDAAALLPPDCMVVVGGEGALLSRYRAQVARRGLEGRIVFIGPIERQELPAYFAAAELFCLASTVRAEAYGVVLLEAMAMGKPVVATEIPGSGVGWINQSGVTGLNVPVRDAAALATAINTLLSDAEMARRFGQAARQRYLEHLDALSMVTATERLYRQLLLPST